MSAADIDIDVLLSKDVRSWTPHKEAGKDQPAQLVGVAVKVDRWTSDYGAVPVPVVELEPEDDTSVLWRIVGYGAVLSKELAPIRVGDRVGIRFTGMVKSTKSGAADYPGFRVVIIPTGTPEPERQPELPAIESQDVDDHADYDGPPF